VVASFSRALTEGLSVQQSHEEFDAALDESLASIFAASVT
jgi:fructose-bisphosphate aldolase class I